MLLSSLELSWITLIPVFFRVMNAIGASASESSFVRQRIDLRLRTTTLLDQTDDFISTTEKMLNQFEKDDEEWRRKGRTLGFDF